MKSVHGGDIYNNSIKHDFSVNLNPLGCPEIVKEAVVSAAGRIEEYPDISQNRVREAVAAVHSVETENVICGNGASELLMAAANFIKPRFALVMAPSFYGYEYAIESLNFCKLLRYRLDPGNGFEVTEDILDMLTDKLDMVYLCNPNNPTGRTISTDLLEKILDKCKENGTWVVLDECFEELSVSAASMVSEIGIYDNLMVLKAYTKLFSAPGVRFGYIVSDAENIDGLARHIPEWNLSVFAEAAAIAGAGILKKGGYPEKVLPVITREREYLTTELSALGIKVFPSDTVFMLVYTEKDIYSLLLGRGILIRDCSNFEGICHGYYRIAIKEHEENRLLIESLKEVL